jgi:hypothetical protein
MFKTPGFIFLMMWSTGSISGQSADLVVKKYFEAIGGEEKVKNLESVKIELKSWYNDQEMNAGAINFLHVPEKTQRAIFKKPVFGFIEFFEEDGKRSSVMHENDVHNCNLIYTRFYPNGYLFEYTPSERRVEVQEAVDVYDLWKEKKLTRVRQAVAVGAKCEVLEGFFVSSQKYSYVKEYFFEIKFRAVDCNG